MSGGTAKPRGKPFEKGQSGNPSGRPAGVPNKVTTEAKEFCRYLVNETYRANFEARFHAGKLHHSLERMVWEYLFGKPKDTIELTGGIELTGTYSLDKATTEDLMALKELLERIERAQATEA